MLEGQVRFAITAPDVCPFVMVSNISHFEHMFWHYWTIGSRKKLFRNDVCEANSRNSHFISSWPPPPPPSALLRRCVLDITICDKVCMWLAAGRWFFPGIPVSSTEIHLALRFMLLFLVLCSVSVNCVFTIYYFLFPIVVSSSIDMRSLVMPFHFLTWLYIRRLLIERWCTNLQT